MWFQSLLGICSMWHGAASVIRNQVRNTATAELEAEGYSDFRSFKDVCEKPTDEQWANWQTAAVHLGLGAGQHFDNLAYFQLELAELAFYVKSTPGEEAATAEGDEVGETGSVGGGRSKSQMGKTFTGALLVKTVEDGDSDVAIKIEKEYYEHIADVQEGQPSLLTTIGICRLTESFQQISGNPYLLIMVNLRRWPSIAQSYDLKGSKWKHMVDRKQRRCNENFFHDTMHLQTLLARNALTQDAVVDGEDIDFVASRSASYRASALGWTKSPCWPDAMRIEPLARGNSVGDALTCCRLAPATPTRSGTGEEQEGTPLHLPRERHAKFAAQLQKDIAFVKKHGLMDYSLIINVIVLPEDASKQPGDCSTLPGDGVNVFPVVGENKFVAVGLIDIYAEYGAGKMTSKGFQDLHRAFAYMVGRRSGKDYQKGEPQGYDTYPSDVYADRFAEFFDTWIRPCNEGGEAVQKDNCCGGARLERRAGV